MRALVCGGVAFFGEGAAGRFIMSWPVYAVLGVGPGVRIRRQTGRAGPRFEPEAQAVAGPGADSAAAHFAAAGAGLVGEGPVDAASALPPSAGKASLWRSAPRRRPKRRPIGP